MSGGKEKIDGHRLRPEIQALRALAVGLVVVYHLWPTRLPGGYVGVDVFFVISGFLITSHIVRGVTSDRRFSISQFYARRVKRLLPASLLVLAVVGVTTLVAVPQTLWLDFGRQVVASAFYIENWALAANSVDYLALGSNSSPVQHFWSLSVEEQFYIVWPLLLIFAALLATRIRRPKVIVIAAIIVGVTVVSLAYSIYATATDPAFAYFITPTRAWEFGMGGIAAIIASRPVANSIVGAALAWSGMAVILITAFAYDSATPFPGYTALLPVLATIAVIIGGNVERWWAPSFIANRLPVQFLGDISYSLYLWHWPLIVLLPIIVSGVGTELTNPMRVVILVGSVGLAWLTKRYVEDPLRSGPRASPRTWRVFAAMAAGMVTVSLIGGIAVATTMRDVAVAETQLGKFLGQQDLSCYGAGSITNGCVGTASGIYPSPLIARVSAAEQECQQRAARVDIIECTYGSNAVNAPRVALVGDSHANQWLPAVREVAEERGWKLTTFFKSGCGFSAAPWVNGSCTEWNAALSEQLFTDPFDMVIVSSEARMDRIAGTEAAQFNVARQGLEDAWQPLLEAGSRVVAIADTPGPGRAGLSDPPSCVLELGDCTFPAEKALGQDPIVQAATNLAGVELVQMTDLFCTDGECPSVIGNILVYRDDNHMTTVYSRTLADQLAARVPSLR